MPSFSSAMFKVHENSISSNSTSFCISSLNNNNNMKIICSIFYIECINLQCAKMMCSSTFNFQQKFMKFKFSSYSTHCFTHLLLFSPCLPLSVNHSSRSHIHLGICIEVCRRTHRASRTPIDSFVLHLYLRHKVGPPSRDPLYS